MTAEMRPGAAEDMERLLDEALSFYEHEFQTDQEVPAADFLELFAEWRVSVRQLMQGLYSGPAP